MLIQKYPEFIEKCEKKNDLINSKKQFKVLNGIKVWHILICLVKQ